MTNIGTVFKKNSTKAMLLGSGELGREVAIELKRLGLEVVAVDKYADAPAMQVADRLARHIDARRRRSRTRGARRKSRLHNPRGGGDSHAKARGAREARFNVVPTAGAVNFTMNRKGIRTLAAEKLGMKTSPYAFAGTRGNFLRP